jgi:putative flippase GtrA
MKQILNIFLKQKQLILYLIIGGFCASLDYIFFAFFIKFFNFGYLFANTISINIGIITSFILNRHYNFKMKDRVFIRFLTFYLIGLLGLVISSGILVVMIEWLSYNEYVSKMFSLVVIAIIQFLLNKFITFKKTKINEKTICNNAGL